jgi:hypothetical protein
MRLPELDEQTHGQEPFYSVNGGHWYFLSVPRANAFHTAKQSHQIRNLNIFERMHSIFDLAARPFVGVTGRESVELFDGLLPREGTGGEPWKILNLVFDDLTVL